MKWKRCIEGQLGLDFHRFHEILYCCCCSYCYYHYYYYLPEVPWVLQDYYYYYYYYYYCFMLPIYTKTVLSHIFDFWSIMHHFLSKDKNILFTMTGNL